MYIFKPSTQFQWLLALTSTRVYYTDNTVCSQKDYFAYWTLTENTGSFGGVDVFFLCVQRHSLLQIGTFHTTTHRIPRVLDVMMVHRHSKTASQSILTYIQVWKHTNTQTHTWVQTWGSYTQMVVSERGGKFTLYKLFGCSFSQSQMKFNKVVK